MLSSLRPSALTMPEVMVWPSPNGLPMATTKSLTFSASESPIGTAVKFFASILSNAISVALAQRITQGEYQ